MMFFKFGIVTLFVKLITTGSICMQLLLPIFGGLTAYHLIKFQYSDDNVIINLGATNFN